MACRWSSASTGRLKAPDHCRFTSQTTMTQPQVLQQPRQPIAAYAMAALCGDVYDLASRLQQARWDAVNIPSADVRAWADQLATAARQMEELARFREGLGE